MVAVQSFSQSHRVIGHARKRQSNPTTKLSGSNDRNIQLIYGMGGKNLSQRWIELVSDGHVTATTVLSDDECDDKGLHVRYGVRLEEGQSQQKPSQQPRLLEFLETLSHQEEEGHDNSLFLSINGTLTEMQQLASNEQNGNASSQNKNGLAIQCIDEGPYAAQLQLVRTLRPPRSKDMSSNTNEKASCQPPPYDSSNDSFLVGPLRLFGHGEFHGDGQPRERAAQLLVPRDGNIVNDESSSTDDHAFASWDVFHNISPVDPRGHYLILPALSNKSEWRDQSLNTNDCYDVTYLASTIEPPGTMALSFNSVGAGASQNHIHCHAWVCPPPPLLCREDTTEHSYAVTKALSTTTHHLARGVTVSLLEYPCTCIKLSAPVLQTDRVNPVLKEMGDALSKIVQIAQKMQAPHNVAWTTRPLKKDNTQNSQSKNIVTIDTYVFFRKAETTDKIESVFRLGASEMLGVFHSSSQEQLESLSSNMDNILSDVSWEPRKSVWKDVCEALDIQSNNESGR